jgi:hypothetical protein
MSRPLPVGLEFARAKYFGTDGIRGRANTPPITPEIALKVGMAACLVFKKGDHRNRVAIGKDTRLSGYMIENALVAGGGGGRAFPGQDGGGGPGGSGGGPNGGAGGYHGGAGGDFSGGGGGSGGPENRRFTDPHGADDCPHWSGSVPSRP